MSGPSADDLSRETVHSTLGVEVLDARPDRMVMRVPVGPKTHQPYGILHGGVSALLAEGAASAGGAMNVGPGKGVVGTELNCSHLRSVTSGHITATATPIRLGRTVHVWGIEIRDDDDRLICVARCSLQVIDLPTAP